MICPFCQHELDVESLACPRCSAVYPRRAGMSFRLKLRTLGLGGLLLLATTYLLSSCVFSDIESRTVVDTCTQYSGGGNCEIVTRGRHISAQASQFGGPNMKDFQVQRMLSMWEAHQQPTQNNAFYLPSKTPAK